MKSSYLTLSIGFFIVIMFAEMSFSQRRNSTVWPYGGKPNPNEKDEWMAKAPLHFSQAVNFSHAKFKTHADFILVRFDSLPDFTWAEFDSLVDFEMANFYSRAAFSWTEFDSLAGFRTAQFHSLADFKWAKFNSLADFNGAEFKGPADFWSAKFYSRADFSETQFHGLARFELAQFHSLANFDRAKFRNGIIFTSATFNGGSRLDFRNAELAGRANFSLATLKDTLFIGTPKSGIVQKYDFMRAYLLPAGQDIIPADTSKKTPKQTVSYPGARIILFGPVELNMQSEKIEFLTLSDTLDYYAKKDIISHLKETSFKGDKFSNARFELDHLFARSTIYQKQSPKFEEYSWYHLQVWIQRLYKWTMGLGYRPFKLLYWVAVINILFAFFYIMSMPKQVNRYVEANFGAAKLSRNRRGTKHLKNRRSHFLDTFINAFYFSFMLFFTFRLKGNLLTFFETREKGIVVFHWLLGFAVYISFLAFSKAGSVLHTLKSLFVG